MLPIGKSPGLGVIVPHGYKKLLIPFRASDALDNHMHYTLRFAVFSVQDQGPHRRPGLYGPNGEISGFRRVIHKLPPIGFVARYQHPARPRPKRHYRF